MLYPCWNSVYWARMKDSICGFRQEDAVIHKEITLVMIKRQDETHCIQDFKLLLCLKNIDLPKKNIFRFISVVKESLIVGFTHSFVFYFSKRSAVN